MAYRSRLEGYALVVGNTHNSKAQEDLMVELFRRADGLILGPCEVGHPEYLDLISRDLPVVAMPGVAAQS